MSNNRDTYGDEFFDSAPALPPPPEKSRPGMRWTQSWDTEDGYRVTKAPEGYHAGYCNAFGAGGIGTFPTLALARKACLEHRKNFLLKQSVQQHIQDHLEAWSKSW